MKKIMVMMLSIAITITSSTFAFATSETEQFRNLNSYDLLRDKFIGTDQNYDDNFLLILEDSTIFKRFRQDIASTDAILIENGKLVYRFDVPNGHTAYVKVSYYNGGVKMDVNEDGLHNTLQLTNDGKLILDENEVEIKHETVVEKTVLDEENTRDSSSWDTDSNPCPNKAWEYQYTSKNSNIKLGKAFKLIGGYAVSVVLSVALPVAAGVIYGAAVTLDSLGDLYDPNSSYASSKIKIYYPVGGQNIGFNTLVTKKVGTFYTQASYGGHSTSKTWYHIKQYY